MGTLLTGYGPAGYDHEGYPAQVLDDGSIRTIRLQELLHRAGEHGSGLQVPGPGPHRLSLLIGALREALDLACALRDHPVHPTT